MDGNQDRYSGPPRNSDELVSRIRIAWDGLNQLLEQVDPAQMAVPGDGGWSIKDHVAHLAAWERYMLLHYLGDMPASEAMSIDAASYRTMDEDMVNDVLLQRSKHRDRQDVMEEFRETHEKVLVFLEAFPFARLLEPRIADNPESGALLNWVIGNTYGHYSEHRLTIERMIHHIDQEKR